MTQDDVKQVVERALSSTSSAYWAAPPEGPAQGELANLQLLLSGMLTKLNQADLESRTSDFQTAAQTMKDSILPAVKKLDGQIAKLVAVDDTLKQALTDAMKLATTTSFFKIPAPCL